jgi:hypothetical protein
MATTLASPSEERIGQVSSRSRTRTSSRSRSAADEESGLGTRFFLPKPGTNGKALELGRELSSEGEARVEALKLGVTYYSVQEWRPVADFAGKNPELKREAVTRKEPG